LFDVLHSKRYLTKIFAGTFKEQSDNLCGKNLEICYGSFIGPIKKTGLDSLYFVSPFEVGFINITDFDYEIPEDNANFGHMFGLFPFNKLSKKSSVTVQNTKVLKNLGRKFDYIKLFSYLNNTPITRDGFIVKYKDGDTCLTNPTKLYESYIFFICDKTKDVRAPRLIAIDDGKQFLI
jgi:hypothetical protein